MGTPGAVSKVAVADYCYVLCIEARKEDKEKELKKSNKMSK